MFPRLIHCVDETPVHPVPTVADALELRALVFAVKKPLAGELGEKIADPDIEKAFLAAEHLDKPAVGPQDHTVVRAEDHNGQGEVEERVLRGRFRAARHGFDIPHQILRPFSVGELQIQGRGGDDDNLGDGDIETVAA